MSSNTLLYLLIYLLSLYATTAFTSQTICKIPRQRQVYDLCPLLQEPVFTVGNYRFNSQNDNGPASCSNNTWICLNGSQTVALSQYSAVSSIELEQQGFRIQFKGGTHNGTTHSALIQFVCDTDSRPEPLSAPKPLTEHDVLHSFRWATKYACLSVSADDPVASEYLRIAEDTESPPDQGEDQEGENLADAPTKPRLSARATAVTVVIIGMVLLTTCYFIYNPPTHLIDQYFRPNLSRLSLPNLPDINNFTLPRFNSVSTSKKYRSKRRTRSHSFRVGESRLVQWAQEDMMEDDVDIMDNAYDDDDAMLDEYVPLSAGMGSQTRRPRDYGTTQYS